VFFQIFLDMPSVKSKFKAVRFISVGISNRNFTEICSVDVSNILIHFWGSYIKKRIVRHLTLQLLKVQNKMFFTLKAVGLSFVGISNRIFTKVCSVDVSYFLLLHFWKLLIFGKVTLKKIIVRHLTLHSPTLPGLEHENEYAVTLICDLTKYLVTIPTPDKSAKL